MTRMIAGADHALTKHLKKKPAHWQVNHIYERLWHSAAGMLSSLSDTLLQTHYTNDEANKWFGIHVDRQSSRSVSRIVETKRFSALMEESMHAYPRSPRRQFPSIVSFVGEIGVGKSTLSKLHCMKEACSSGTDCIA